MTLTADVTGQATAYGSAPDGLPPYPIMNVATAPGASATRCGTTAGNI
jgi:hypothetical protein